jgi:hypothetical protein
MDKLVVTLNCLGILVVKTFIFIMEILDFFVKEYYKIWKMNHSSIA